MDVTEPLNAIEISSYVYMRGGPVSAGLMYAKMKPTRPDPERFGLDQEATAKNASHDLRIVDKPQQQKTSQQGHSFGFTRPLMWMAITLENK